MSSIDARRRVVFKAGFAATMVGAGLPALAQNVVLRLSHPIGKQTAHQVGAEYFARRVSEISKGQAKVEVYPDGQLGSEAKVLEGLQTGTIDMTMSTLWTNVVTAGKVFDLPFLFRDFAQWKAIMHGKPGDMAAEAAKGTNVRVAGYWYAGSRNIYGSRRVQNMHDLAGLKIRTLQAPAYVELFKAVKAIPTPIAWPETYLALQQKTVDEAEAPFESMYDANQYEVAKFGAHSKHAFGTAAFLVSEPRWNAYPEPVRQAIVAAQKEAFEVHAKKFVENEAKVVGLLEAKGFTFSPFDSTEMRAIVVKDVYPKLVVDPLAKRILEEAHRV
jgi:TRAP-type transport system periplasmic protein